MRRWWPPGVLLLLALAGCWGHASVANTVRLGDGSRISLDLPPSESPAPEDIHGAISGVVVDDAIFPVAGVEIVMRVYGERTTSDENGLFSFTAMPPGIVILEAHKAGHAVGLGTVEVHSGQVAKSILQAPRLPATLPYHTTIAIERPGNLDATLFGTPDDVVAFDLPPATVVLEATWAGLQGIPGTDPLQYHVTPASQPKSSIAGTGPNPLRVAFEGTAFPAHEYAISLNVEPDYTTTVPTESRGKVFLTLFYVKPAPDGWSLVAGSQ